ncbi:MAG TPA: glycosyltransferase, partial [Phototrophicaceae bacterium]|nr:glycosyltransferase [Phototrophicaceae bacterium]
MSFIVRVWYHGLMHILHLTPYYAPAYAFGGVVRSVEGMARALVRRGHRVTVLTTDALDQHQRYAGPAVETRDGVQIIRAANLSPALRGRLNLSTPFTIGQLARRWLPEVDVVHCHEFRTVENLLVTPLAAHLKKPLVLSPHGTLALNTGRSSIKSVWDQVFSRAVARRFTQVVGLTAAEMAEAQTLWATLGAQATFSVIPNGVDPAEYADLPGRETFRQRYGLGDAPVCLFMARLHPRKGIGVLVEAFRQANIPGARLVIVGPDEGALAALQPYLDERIIITGYLGGIDRLAALAAADMLALPAVGEGLPMVVLEALAAGLPVLISPGCYLPEVAQHGAGLEVEPAVEPLAAALTTLLTNSPLRQQMGAAARELVSARFTWDAVAAQLETVSQQITFHPPF